MTHAGYHGLQGPLHVHWHDRACERRATVRRNTARCGDDLQRSG